MSHIRIALWFTLGLLALASFVVALRSEAGESQHPKVGSEVTVSGSHNRVVVGGGKHGRETHTPPKSAPSSPSTPASQATSTTTVTQSGDNYSDYPVSPAYAPDGGLGVQTRDGGFSIGNTDLEYLLAAQRSAERDCKVNPNQYGEDEFGRRVPCVRAHQLSLEIERLATAKRTGFRATLKDFLGRHIPLLGGPLASVL